MSHSDRFLGWFSAVDFSLVIFVLKEKDDGGQKEKFVDVSGPVIHRHVGGDQRGQFSTIW